MEWKRLYGFLEDIEKKNVPQAECIVTVKGKVVFRYNSCPTVDKGLYNLYSLTKVMVCVAALQLYERGYYLLDDNVSRYLPEWSTVKIRRGQECRLPNREVTIRDLFTMTAGLDYNLQSLEIQDIIRRTEGRCPTREVVKAIAEGGIRFEPGSHFCYSLCHDIIGALIEVWSGQKLSDYMKKHLFLPAGMLNTGFNLFDTQKERLLPQYKWGAENGCARRISSENPFRLGTEYESGGAGLISCADDLSVFADMLCRRGRTVKGEDILGKGTIELMRMDHLNETEKADFLNVNMPGYSYGLGVRTLSAPVLAGALGNIGEFGWDGAAGSYLLVDTKAELTIVYLQHVLDSDYKRLHLLLRNIIYGILRER